jgi:hypothetical protein
LLAHARAEVAQRLCDGRAGGLDAPGGRVGEQQGAWQQQQQQQQQ